MRIKLYAAGKSNVNVESEFATPKELKHWDRIKVSYEDAQMLAVNGLPINRNVIQYFPARKKTNYDWIFSEI